MRSISKIVLLSAGILLSLTACQKGNENGSTSSGKEVQFGAISGTPGTRTEFSGVLTDGWERINWKKGDQILIWSDHAKNRANQPGNSAVYDIVESSISAQGKESHASIHRAGEDGLVFLDEASAYQFWGIYPANAVSAAPAAGELSFSIPATQASGDMNNGVMLAYTSIPSEQHVDLCFKPAYTAFSITVAAAVDMNITGVTMTSVERKNGENTFGPSVLNGTVAAKVENDAWTYTVSEPSDDNTSISASFAENPLVLAKETADATKTNEVTIVLFAVPEDITSLTFKFDVTVGDKSETRKVTISYAKGDTSDEPAYAAGDPVSFAKMKKHNIKGLVLPASVNHDIVLDFQVMPWNTSEDEVTYGPDDIVNAVALEYASGAGRTTGGDRRRNNWFLDATNPIIAYFSVFTPNDGATPNGHSWKIKVSGATDKFTVTSLTTGSTTTTTDDGVEITGPINGRVLFKIDRVGTVTESDKVYLNFYVVTKDGREISINSEITRGNALTISGKVGAYQP